MHGFVGRGACLSANDRLANTIQPVEALEDRRNQLGESYWAPVNFLARQARRAAPWLTWDTGRCPGDAGGPGRQSSPKADRPSVLTGSNWLGASSALRFGFGCVSADPCVRARPGGPGAVGSLGALRPAGVERLAHGQCPRTLVYRVQSSDLRQRQRH